MIGAWTINMGGRTYGPYPSERMRAFAMEGRLGPHSLVAREGLVDWHDAEQEPEFSKFFAPNPNSGSDAAPSTAAYGGDSDGVGKSRLLIAVAVNSRIPRDLENEIMSLGTAYKLLSNVWIVSTDHSVNDVRNRLIQELGTKDSLFVIDAAHDKAAWFNFGAEADVRIRRVWKKAS